jgi:hypothetical protein
VTQEFKERKAILVLLAFKVQQERLDYRDSKATKVYKVTTALKASKVSMGKTELRAHREATEQMGYKATKDFREHKGNPQQERRV